MIRSFVAVLAVLTLAFGFNAQASTAGKTISCKTPAHKAAFHVRSVQTDLSEAGFSCNMADEYADFKKRFGKSLGKHSRALEKRFNNRKKFQTYITDIANRAALRAAIKRDAFCTRAKGLYSATKGLPAKDLGKYAMSIVDSDTDVPSGC